MQTAQIRGGPSHGWKAFSGFADSTCAWGSDKPPTLASSREFFSSAIFPPSPSPLLCQNLEFCVKLLNKLLGKIKDQKGSN